jgi:hypothetical protein
MSREPFTWNEQTEQAAALLAEGRLSDAEIATRIGVHRKTLYRWRKDPAFTARVTEILDRVREETLRRGIAVKTRRIDVSNSLWERLLRVAEERAADPLIRGVPGGSTGLVTARRKILRSGDAAEEVVEHALDTGLLKALVEIQKLAARELGQWAEPPVAEQYVKTYSIEASPETLWQDPNSPTTSPGEWPTSSGTTGEPSA